MGSGTGIPLPITPPVIGVLSPVPKWLSKMSLDTFSRITHYDPLVFQGVKLFGKCDPLHPQGREAIIEAFNTSFGLMDAMVIARGKSTFDANCILETHAPHIDLTGYQPRTLVETTYAANITYPFPQHKTSYDDIATLALTITALDVPTNEAFVSAMVTFDPLGSKRFGVSLLASSLVGTTLTLKARAYNFIDVDNITDPANPPFLSTVNVIVSTMKDSIPQILWPAAICDTGNPPTVACTYQSTEGCLRPTTGNEYDVVYTRLCTTTLPYAAFGNYIYPVKFQLSAVRNGVWQNTWQDAMISLANCLITESYGECQPLVNERWENDQGKSIRYKGTYIYSYWNPFGTSMPGAQRCWKVVQLTLGSGAAWDG